MKCRVCGSTLRASTTDLPFKVSDRTIVILKDLPVEQCEACSEYLIGDPVFARVEALLSGHSVPADQKPSVGCNIKWKVGGRQ